MMLAIGYTIMGIGFMLNDDDNRAKLSGNNFVNVGTTIFCFAVIFQLLRPLRWLLFLSSIGPVVVSCLNCLKDFFQVTILYLVILNAFAIGSFSMFKTFDQQNLTSLAQQNLTLTYFMHQDDFVEFKGLFGGFFWRLFDPGNPDYATINKCNPKEENKNLTDHCEYDGEDIREVSVEFSHLLGLVMWAIYQIVTVVIVLNILIAMMTTTYTRIYNNADTEWKYSKSFHHLDFLHSSTILPIPFR